MHHAEGVPRQFREDVIRVFKTSGSSIPQVAKDYGISPSRLKRWLTIDDRNSVNPSPAARAANESDALRESNIGSSCWSRRTRSRISGHPDHVFLKLLGYLPATVDILLARTLVQADLEVPRLFNRPLVPRRSGQRNQFVVMSKDMVASVQNSRWSTVGACEKLMVIAVPSTWRSILSAP